MNKLLIKHFIIGVFVFILFWSLFILIGLIFNPVEIEILIESLYVIVIMAVIYSGIFTIIDYFVLFKKRVNDIKGDKL